MNYIAEINSFYDWLETNDISKSAIALWGALMHINNKAGWKTSFAVAVSTLEFKTKFRRSELFEARNILEQKGRIKWESRGGSASAIYEMIPLCVHNADANAYTNPYTNPTQTHTQNRPLDKLNYTKLNKESSTARPEKKNEPAFPKKEIQSSSHAAITLENSNLYRKPKIPQLEQVESVFYQKGGTLEMAKKFFEKHSATGWYLNNSPITNWSFLAQNFIANWQKNEVKNTQNGTKTSRSDIAFQNLEKLFREGF